MVYEIRENKQFKKDRKKYSSNFKQINAIIQDLKEDPFRYGSLMQSKSHKGIRHERITKNLRLYFSICEECNEYRIDPTPYCHLCPPEIENKVFLHTIVTHGKQDKIRR
ncbi:MAG: hypothetical protein HWN66_11320 [Candidatus Helarchaeota archaeon]|nr:hypothetical protein [Candidatus Helarchaeota archaeon]